MINKNSSPYNNSFYENQVEGSLKSAKVVLGFLYDIYKPLSVVDVGCGRGAWLSVAEKLGSKFVTGMDGEWINEVDLLTKTIDFKKINFDFEDVFNANENFDLCMSLEVAEHIDYKKAESFVKTLCSLSEVVLFGAAIKYQGGTNHVNEQWQDYWLELFKKNDYQCFDIIRPNLWNNEEVEWWYRQNTFIFVKQGSQKISQNILINLQRNIPNIVHPDNYISKVDAIDSIVNGSFFNICLFYIKSLLKRKAKTIKLWLS